MIRAGMHSRDRLRRRADREGDRPPQQNNVRLAEVFEDVDLIITPTTGTTAFRAEGPMPMEIDGEQVKPMRVLVHLSVQRLRTSGGEHPVRVRRRRPARRAADRRTAPLRSRPAADRAALRAGAPLDEDRDELRLMPATPGRDAPPNMTDYAAERASFRLDVPERFNFVADVIEAGRGRSRTTSRCCRSTRTARCPRGTPILSCRATRTGWRTRCSGSGSRKATRCSCMLPRIPQWYATVLGAIRIGAIPMPGTPLLTSKDIAYRDRAGRRRRRRHRRRRRGEGRRGRR